MSCKRVLLADILASPAFAQQFCVEFGSALKQGALCIYPTETIYGLGGLQNNTSVAARIFEAKKRPTTHQLIVLSASFSALSALDLNWAPNACMLSQTFWPDNLTLVLPTGDDTTLGIRQSSHPFMQTLHAHQIGPLYSTSANISGQPYHNDINQIYDDFKDSVEYCIDAGELAASLPSTVVSISADNKVTVLREGALPAQMIYQAVDTISS